MTRFRIVQLLVLVALPFGGLAEDSVDNVDHLVPIESKLFSSEHLDERWVSFQQYLTLELPGSSKITYCGIDKATFEGSLICCYLKDPSTPSSDKILKIAHFEHLEPPRGFSTTQSTEFVLPARLYKEFDSVWRHFLLSTRQVDSKLIFRYSPRVRFFCSDVKGIGDMQAVLPQTKLLSPELIALKDFVDFLEKIDGSARSGTNVVLEGNLSRELGKLRQVIETSKE